MNYNYFPESHYEKMREMDKTSPDNYCSWVGLTDQEVAQLASTYLFENVWPLGTFAAIRAIETKLKEKNEHTY